MRDKIAKWVYLAVERRVWGRRLIITLYWLSPLRPFIPRAYFYGEQVWSTEMFDKQLDGL